LQDVFKQYYDEGRLWFGSDGNGVPRQKNYLSERNGKTIWTWWTNTEVGHTQEATQDLAALLQQKAVFDYPKPVRIIQRIIQVATAKNSIVLDSFAGSGTTAHAVLTMNKQDGGNRKFILVEMMDYAETITAERVRRVIDGYGSVEGTGGSFSFYDLGETLLNGNQTINEAVPTQKIREYVYYIDTKQHLPPLDEEEPYKLGVYNDIAYYFYYEKERATTLNHEFLATIRTQAEGYIIYADMNALSDDDLLQYNIVFRKIPRDIAKL
jgi:adenine-specific DNA-methyltransferase